MPKSSKETESLISEACEIARQQEKPNTIALGRDFGVSRYRLHARLVGCLRRTRHPALHKTLDDT